MMSPSDRRSMERAFALRREIVSRRQCGQLSALEEPELFRDGRGWMQASVYWRYMRIYGRLQ